MSYIEIKRSDDDLEFRKVVKELLDSAKREIIIIAGELSSLYFPELYKALENAVNRGVKVKIYAVEPPSNIVRTLKKLKCELIIGRKRPKDHYLIVDGKSCVISEKADVEFPTIGTRHGKYFLNNPSEAKKYAQIFEKLKPYPFKKLLLTALPITIFFLLFMILVINLPGEIAAASLIVALTILTYILR